MALLAEKWYNGLLTSCSDIDDPDLVSDENSMVSTRLKLSKIFKRISIFCTHSHNLVNLATNARCSYNVPFLLHAVS